MTRGDTFALGLIIGILILYTTSTYIKRQIHRRRWQNAKQSEVRAAALLKHNGFHIVRRQPTARSLMYVNGKPKSSIIRADFLARKGLRTYIVEVKSGRTAPRLRANTRRQLLEYQLAFRPHGIILMDMQEEKQKEILFRSGCDWSVVLLLGLTSLAALILGGTAGYILGKGTWL